MITVDFEFVVSLLLACEKFHFALEIKFARCVVTVHAVVAAALLASLHPLANYASVLRGGAGRCEN